MRQLQTQKSSSIEVVLAKWIGIPLLVSGVAYASVKAFTEYSACEKQCIATGASDWHYQLQHKEAPSSCTCMQGNAKHDNDAHK
jgi:hypothetical protein